ncbi:MAG: hypothetical protein IK151_07215 [Erysipelotrichaceae bacterium]|nr:hypothetical protein [Erysipelotrichaceae bacterium]
MGKKKKAKKRLIVILLFLVLIALGSLGALIYINKQNNITEPYYLASAAKEINLKDKEGNEGSFVRGTEVNIKRKRVEIEGNEMCQFVDNDTTYYVSESDLRKERNDCVLETELYALRDHVLTSDYNDFHISGWIEKKDQLSISGFHELLDDGTVDYYQVNNTGYISSKYVSTEYYETGLDSSIYADLYYGDGGSPEAIDYYAKESFTPLREMPEKVNALYINAEAVSAAEQYIDIAKQTSGINAFVVDIKDCYIDTQLAYVSPVGQAYAPSTENIPNSFGTYQSNLKKLKDAGYYLIGRITAFKDDSFAIDNPDEALMYNGSLYSYGSVKWPSVFSRKMWEYNVALALEAVEQMGFDEIQFDYVRLPEDVEDVELRNTYGETRAEAVTKFLRYAAEMLHDRGIYISADVFGETSGDDYTQFSSFVSYYGQFWPAISNAVDAISSMPYPDHFAPYSYGIAQPWIDVGELMYRWGKATYYAQENTYDAAKCRTWIMAQNSDPYEVYYDESFIKAQIDGLRNAGVCDGYLTWNAASSLSKYESYISAFD